jgi:hypothetical protein
MGNESCQGRKKPLASPLSPLRGLAVFGSRFPPFETVGYSRASLRDYRKADRAAADPRSETETRPVFNPGLFGVAADGIGAF